MRRSLLLIAGALLALVVPATAVAKGPSEATITGPGLSSPITFRGGGEGGNDTSLGMLVTQGGFFAQTFGQSPDPMLAARPARLGPRYEVTYTVPGPSTDMLRQDLYPYATDGPVTYMATGQMIWDQTTHGGWYRGAPELKSMLVKAGLPKTALAVHRDSTGTRHKRIALGAGAGIALAAGALIVLRRRR